MATSCGCVVNIRMNNKTIRHCGVITQIDGSRVRVRCVRLSACDSCDMSASCSTPKGKNFYVDAVVAGSEEHRVGDRVVVETSVSNGRNAVALGFVLPLVAFLAALFAARSVWHSDAAAALCGLGVCALYYLLLYAMRSTLNRKFRFVVSDNNFL